MNFRTRRLIGSRSRNVSKSCRAFVRRRPFSSVPVADAERTALFTRARGRRVLTVRCLSGRSNYYPSGTVIDCANRVRSVRPSGLGTKGKQTGFRARIRPTVRPSPGPALRGWGGGGGLPDRKSRTPFASKPPSSSVRSRNRVFVRVCLCLTTRAVVRLLPRKVANVNANKSPVLRIICHTHAHVANGRATHGRREHIPGHDVRPYANKYLTYARAFCGVRVRV